MGRQVTMVRPEWPGPQYAWEGLFHSGIAARLAPTLQSCWSDIDPGQVNLIERT